jgi:caffeoyl-CoA O-methyltransferase
MFIHPSADDYCVNHTGAESNILRKLNRETHAKILRPRMLSGHFQGKLLEMISCMLQPSLILEIGTYTGYSAICMAAGLMPGGKIITIDHNEELEDFTRKHFEEAGMTGIMDYRIGEALEVLPQLQGSFDLVFIDADKENYLQYYEMVLGKTRQGGIILADNVLWSGKVFSEKLAGKDPEALALIEFNDFVNRDPRVEKVMLPIRDGLYLIRKL